MLLKKHNSYCYKLEKMNFLGAVFNFNQFINWMSSLVAQGNSSGNQLTPQLLGFIALNLKRIERLNKTIELNDELLTALVLLQNKQHWVVISEAWCGDSAQTLPVIAKIAELSNGMIDLQIILRDENPELMNKYLTNGSKSIPKLIAFGDRKNELFTWGPRPAAAQEIFWNWKNNPNGKTWDDFEKELHTWYAKDKTKAIQSELLIMLKKSKQTTPSKKFTFSKN